LTKDQSMALSNC